MLADDYIKQMKSQRVRITRTRKAMVDIFTASAYPLSPQDLGELLAKKSVKVNKTTIYREIDFLVKRKFIGIVKIVGKSSLYELCDRKHHHHVVCNDCGIIQDVSLPETNLLKEVIKQTQFDISEHSLEFYGRCRQCQ